MSILITIICIIIVLIFWRIFLPLALAAGAIIFIWYLGDVAEKENKVQRAQEHYEQVIRKQQTTNLTKGTWKVTTRRDPASDIEVTRNAYVYSDDGLCSVQVEHRINGNKYIAFYCNGLTHNLSGGDDMTVKFDIHQKTKEFWVARFSNGESVYISSERQYTEFIDYMKTANVLAVRFPMKNGKSVWVKFNMKGSTNAINQLGKQK